MSKAKWIWYPGDFEIELANKFMANRYERDVFIPPFWKQYSCYKNVKFMKIVELEKAEKIEIRAEGKLNVTLNGSYLFGLKGSAELKKGKNELVISVYNDKGVPCILVEGESVRSGEDWLVTCNDHKWVYAKTDEELLRGGSTPNNVKLAKKELAPVGTFGRNGRTIYDFGRETFAYVKLSDAKVNGEPRIYYGESPEEAADIENCELTSEDFIKRGGTVTTRLAKAFRYITAEGLDFGRVSAVVEYLPMPKRSFFRCNDPLLNRIYDTAEYTLFLNTREFLIDGIKRDRWVWSGDAYQSYLMHYYSYFDKSVIRRTMLALFGKSPFDLYINHIMDYSFFWIMGLYDYYRYTGDGEFVGENLGKAFEIMDYILGRTDESGFVDSRAEDWVFVDWAELDNSGEVCFEQILMLVSLKNCAELGEAFGEKEKAENYRRLQREKSEALDIFWDEEKGAYVYSRKNGKLDGKILRHPNMFAVLYGVCSGERRERISESVLKNPSVPAITTPYMKFYEYAAMCELGEREYVLDEIRAYWGGMLKEGATTFWEAYDAGETGAEKYAMYGRKYGKSLCHAWGASPLYLIGKYIVGLTPCEGGFLLEPCLAGLEYFDAELPLSEGSVKVSVTKEKISVYSERASGKLKIRGKFYEIIPGEKKEIGYR